VYGVGSLERLALLHVCVIGIGGVGAWAVEALARSGVGKITMIDNDDIALSNINRQLHALDSTLLKSKVEVMAARVLEINPDCQIVAIDDLIVSNNVDNYLRRGYDYVIDAIDNVRFKADIIYYCKRNKIPVITTGGAGGATDPTMIEVADLAKTWNDPLAAKVRARLRQHYGWTRNPKRRFSVECVFSTEQPLYPQEGGGVGTKKPGVKGLTLDCNMGYGSLAYVTGSFGLIAASRVINNYL